MAKVTINSTDSPKDSRTPINNMFTELYTGANVVAATEKTTPVDADKLPIQNSADSNLLYWFSWANLKATLKTYFDTLYGTSGSGAGWIALGACTYEGADAPSFTFSLASDMTGILSVGMRIMLTQTTAKYFIITAVGAYSGGKTIITVYGGTDYTLANAAITAPYYSIQKSPFGFPLDPTKWTVEVSDTTIRDQATPTTGTWYNLGSITISIPIGSWRVNYLASADVRSTDTDVNAMMTLSTANNSESDIDFSCLFGYFTAAGIESTLSREKVLTLSSKTPYYLNQKIDYGSGVSHFYLRSDKSKTIIRATSAYL